MEEEVPTEVGVVVVTMSLLSVEFVVVSLPGVEVAVLQRYVVDAQPVMVE